MRFKIKKQSFAQKCDICHQADCFDAVNNFCSRCAELKELLASQQNIKVNLLTEFLQIIRIGVAALFFGCGSVAFLFIASIMLDPTGFQQANDSDPFSESLTTLDCLYLTVFDLVSFLSGYLLLPNNKFIKFIKSKLRKTLTQPT